MSKVFRLYEGGKNTYQGWNASPIFPYNSTNRDTIEDPDGASARNEITSIPSPFARIDLVKTAFKEVCKAGKLDGNTIFHKMVSDTLDVGEIFFNIDKYKDKVEIITWNVQQSLQTLGNDGDDAHFYYADALDKYLKSDAQTYHFDKVQNIYLLNYVNGPDELNIIGATSPATLFFSSANKLDYVNDIFFNQDRPFDHEFMPLFKRDKDYIKAWFTLRKTIPGFATLFPEVDDYLTLTFRALTDTDFKQELNKLSDANLADFSNITVSTAQQSNNVEILGYNLLKKQLKVVSTESEFTIKPTVQSTGSILPLVLPVEAGNKYSSLLYTSGPWGTTNVAPFIDTTPDYTKRSLPCDGTPNPYLTISDFLEDTIIRVPHKLNSEHYFNGNIVYESDDHVSYLLPLKPLFFKFFTADDLINGMVKGKHFIDMHTLPGGSVKVILHIPVKGNQDIADIEYTRKYYNNRGAVAEKNEGGITELDFTGLVMPMVKFADPAEAVYNVSCVSTFSKKYQFYFYLQGSQLTKVYGKCRNENEEFNFKSDNYRITGSNFDYIQIEDRDADSVHGIVLPIFKQQRNINTFEFAVDLGTSNTHIEYKTQGEAISKPFDMTKKENILCQFFNPIILDDGTQRDLQQQTELIEKDFLPSIIGQGDFKFPTRTILSCAQTIDWNNLQNPFQLYNLPLTYDKRMGLKYDKYLDNIKWGKGTEQAMDAYVECVALMLRNKVLMNDGDLSKTKITWFYPLSMPRKRIQKLRDTWNNIYASYFSPSGETNCMTESGAPIIYYFTKYATATNLVNIDMGGGTTDVAFARNKEVQYVTSFKYATNILFSNAFSEIDFHNGIIDAHKEDILKLLNEKNLNELVSMFNSQNNQKPTNMASFLFSLSNNSKLKDADINRMALDFSKLLRDDENLKIVFILYYAAIIYHVANIIKVKQLEAPRHIAFSGNGSKVINIISTDIPLIEQLTKIILEHVLGKAIDTPLEILGLEKDAMPKASTCKGGLLATTDNTSPDSIVILKGDGSEIVDKNSTYEDLTEQDYNSTINAVQKFFDYVLNKLNDTINLDDAFGVSRESLQIAREVCKNDLHTFLKKGIAQRCEHSDDKNEIEETSFFYPIMGVINAVSLKIYDSLENKKNEEE